MSIFSCRPLIVQLNTYPSPVLQPLTIALSFRTCHEAHYQITILNKFKAVLSCVLFGHSLHEVLLIAKIIQEELAVLVSIQCPWTSPTGNTWVFMFSLVLWIIYLPKGIICYIYYRTLAVVLTRDGNTEISFLIQLNCM